MERVQRAELMVSLLLAAAMVGAIVYAAWVASPAPARPPFVPAPSFVLMPQNASFVVPPGGERTYTYSNTSASNYLAGLFNATADGPCGNPCWLFPGIFLMNPAQFATFQGGSFDGYLSGALYATNVSIFRLLPAGTFYLVFWNHGDQFASNLSLRFTATMPLDGYNASTQAPTPPSPPPDQILLSAQSITIGDGFSGGPWVRYEVTLAPTYWNYTISGAFSASGGATTLYFFTPTQFTALSSSYGAVNMPSSYAAVFSVGPTVGASFNASVPAGSYILVFTNENVGPGTLQAPSVYVDVTQNITATPA